MSTKKFIEIKFLYFLKPNSSSAFFSFSRSGKTRNLPSRSQCSPFCYSRCWKGKITFSEISVYYIVHVKVQNDQTMFIQIVFDNFESNQTYVQKSVKVATTQRILPVTFDDNVIFTSYCFLFAMFSSLGFHANFATVRRFR